jgi:hypothetical protein
MAKAYKYGHRADGHQPWERARMHGYDYCLVSENIAYRYNASGFTSEELAAAFFDGWKNSTEHRKNLLDADVTQIGVAISRNKDTGYYFAVQMFGRPKSQIIEFRITNQTSATFKYKVDGDEFALPPAYNRAHSRCRQPKVQIALADPQQGAPVREFFPRHGDECRIVRGAEGRVQLEVRNKALGAPPTVESTAPRK